MDSDSPLVTVITVTYNSGKYVRDAIESVLAQHYLNIEYIIGDDSSSDDTWSVIQEYEDPRIRRYRNHANMGEYQNRNKAIDLATGKYIYFVDGDDLVFPHGVAFFVKMLESFPEAGMAIQKNYFNSILFPALLYPEETITNHYFGRFSLLSSSFCSNFFRASILKELRLSTKYVSGDDDVRVRLAARYPVIFVAGWVSWPRETPGQASSRIPTHKRLLEILNYSREALSESNHELKQELVTDIRKTLMGAVARLAIREALKGRPDHGRSILSQAGMSLATAARLSRFKPSNRDMLLRYTPANPFRRGFLQDGLHRTQLPIIGRRKRESDCS